MRERVKAQEAPKLMYNLAKPVFGWLSHFSFRLRSAQEP